MKSHTILMVTIVFFSIIIFYILANTVGRKIWGYFMYSQTPLPVSNEAIENDGSYTNIIFLHHSTGRNLIEGGQVRTALTKKGYAFWDHDYNFIGLKRPDGSKTGTCYNIPDDTTDFRGNGNTNPDGLAILFKQPVHNPPDNAFSRLLQHEVIIFKSCFPNSAIKSEQMLNQYKEYFMAIRDVIDKHPDKVFIPLTIPPLHPLKTNPDEAKRAREWANWLKSVEFLNNHSNIYVFDYFDFLADSSTNMLRGEYQIKSDKPDSHPNNNANKIIGPILTDFTDSAIKNYRSQ